MSPLQCSLHIIWFEVWFVVESYWGFTEVFYCYCFPCSDAYGFVVLLGYSNAFRLTLVHARHFYHMLKQ